MHAVRSGGESVAGASAPREGLGLWVGHGTTRPVVGQTQQTTGLAEIEPRQLECSYVFLFVPRNRILDYVAL